MDSKVAQAFGKYEVISELGRGGMGIVYRARDPVIGRSVAIKTLTSELLSNPDSLKRFYREAQAAGRLQHPNLVTIYDLGEASGSPYIAMEFVEGESLRDVIVRQEPLQLAQKLKIIKQFCQGLGFAHRHGLVHRDVKPANILIRNDGTAKVVDFGIVHVESTTMTKSGTFMGTVYYASPEQLNNAPVDLRSDIFSVGVVIYEFLSYRRPFDSPTMAGVINLILNRDPVPLGGLVPGMPAALEALVSRCLEKDPEKRFQSLEDLVFELDPVASLLQHSRAEELVSQVPDLIARRDLAHARDVLRDALMLESNHPAAKSLLSEVNSEIKRLELSTRVNAFISEGKMHQDRGDYDAAAKSFEEAVKADSENAEARTLLTDAREKLARANEVRQAIASAKIAYRGGDLTRAEVTLEHVLELDAANSEAQVILDQIRQERSERERSFQLREGLWEVRGLLERGGYEAALERLAGLKKEFPNEAEVEAPLKEVRRKLEELSRGINTVKDCLKVGKFQEARDRAGVLAARFPQRQEAGDLYESAKVQLQLSDRRQALEAQLLRIHQLIDSCEFAQAIEECERSHTEFPDSIELDRLAVLARSQKQAEELQRQVEEACERIRAALTAERYDDAAAEADRELTRFPGSADLLQMLVAARRGQFEAARQGTRGEAVGVPEAPGAALTPSTGIPTANQSEGSRYQAPGQPGEQPPPEGQQGYNATQLLWASDVTTIAPSLRKSQVPSAPTPAPPVTKTSAEAPPARAPGQPSKSAASQEPQAYGATQLLWTRDIPTVTGGHPESKGTIAPSPAPPGAGVSRHSGGAIDASETAPPTEKGAVLSEPPARSDKKAWRTALLAVAGVVVAVVAVMIVRLTHKKPPPPPAPVLFAVRISTAPAGAQVAVDDQSAGVSPLNLKLAAGVHKVRATLDGYQPAEASATVGPRSSGDVSLSLSALDTSIHLFTDLDSGEVLLEGKSQGELQDGQFALDRVDSGKHVLGISSNGQMVSVDFEVAAGAAPAVTAPVKGQNFAVIVVSNLGARARVIASKISLKVGLTGQPTREVGTNGVEWDNLTPGPQELVVDDGASQQKKIIDIGPAPTLTVLLTSNRDVGNLVVLVSEDGAKVSIDGKPQKRLTARGQFQISNLKPKQYTVQVEKDGFQKEPAQTVQVQKGQEASVTFKLKPLERFGGLALKEALPGAQVLMDGNAIGTVAADGTFAAPKVAPGDHTFELRKDGYVPKQLTKRVSAGQTLPLGGNEVLLKQETGVLLINVSPPTTSLTISQGDQGQPKPVNPGRNELSTGTYTVVARWPSGSEQRSTAQVQAGSTEAITLTLARVSMNGWNAKEWQSEGTWYVHTGKGIVLFNPTPTAGTFVFTAEARGGNSLSWIIDYRDPENYVACELSSKSFVRREVVRGVARELRRGPNPLGKIPSASLRIVIAAGSITQELYDGKEFTALDDWKDPSRNFSAGKFGFLLASGGENLMLSNFSFSPQ